MKATARRIATASLSLALLTGAAAAMAPTASAASRPPAKCSYNFPDFWGWVDTNGTNVRTGPSTSYSSRGQLYVDDRMTIRCGRGDWYYGTIVSAKNGLRGSGWVRHDMILNN
ncbi:SH3 domain-containing protein [Streptomyces hygroscopicus]|uniref:SH3 domain-containing protein n=1 Tax=Streptomyces hygroscopicus TaxID=1912 RepID=UPI001FCC806A|nr:SH3 domain-containing protein [Streptomyces hygroscopicus]BDH10498.1 hypothetical protein HOK021_16770 [Streptomyces hygroscopicus]